MMLEITLGEAIAVRFDDCIDDYRSLTPEQCEDYLSRMRRTAIKIYKRMPDVDADDIVTTTDEHTDQG